MGYPQELATHFLGVGALIIRDGQVLLVKLTYGRASKFWLIPGGLVEKGETLEEGVIREVKEEVGLDVQPTGIIGIRSMVRDDDLTDVYTIFSCTLNDISQQVFAQESEIADARWFDLSNLEDIEGMSAYTSNIVKTYLENSKMQRDFSFDEEAKKRIRVRKYEQYWISS